MGCQGVSDKIWSWLASAPQQCAKEPRGGVAIPARLDQDVEDVAVLVDGAPAIVPLAADGDEEFVEMPGVADAALPSPEPPGVGEAKGLTSVPDGFVRDDDATVREHSRKPRLNR